MSRVHQRVLLLLVIATACIAGDASAQFRHSDPHQHVLWVADDLPHQSASRDWFDTGRLGPVRPDGTGPWLRFEEVMGQGWKVNPDAAFGTPRWIVGPGLDTGIAPLDAAFAERHARGLIERLGAVFGIERPDERLVLADVTSTRNAHGHEILGIDFQQVHDGLEVWSLNGPRRVRFVYNATLGRLAALGSDWIEAIAISSWPAYSRADAAAKALDLVPAFAPGQGRVLDTRLYVLVGLDPARRARLVYEVRIQTKDTPHLWTVIVDAKSGDRLYLADAVCSADVTGQVSLGSLDGAGGAPPSSAFTVKPARALYVSVAGGGSTLTDANGNFRISHGGTSPVTVQGTLAGAWCTIGNKGGPGTQFQVGATPGTPANIVLNGTHTHEFQTAEATAYHWVTEAHYFIKKHYPGYPGLKQFTTNVNMSNQCNAYFDGTSINFYRAGTQCNNMAAPDVIVHEWGHAFHHTWFGAIRNNGFSEGIGDHLSLYMSDQRLMGRGIGKSSTMGRDYRTGGAANQTKWPKTGQPSVHRDGEIWAGAMMDLRDNLVAKHGTVAGKNLSEILTIAPYARKPADMPSALVGIFLQDDNDANVNNGTPNFASIAAAADRHDLPRPPDPSIVQIVHTPIDDHGDIVNGQIVSAKITSPAGTITSAQLTYQVGGHVPVTVGMVKGAGDVYTAAIPAQPAVTRVVYSIFARDAKSNSVSEPRSGSHAYTVGHAVRALSDAFETSGAWTAANDDNAIRGRFERADPYAAAFFGQFPAQPEDDNTPGAGRLCYVTQNGVRNQDADQHDVDGGRTSLVSPVFELSAVPAGQAQLSFAYWHTSYAMMAPDPFVVAISSDGGKTWKDILTFTQPSAAWKTKTSISLPPPYTTGMRLRFRVAETSMFSVTDVLVDDVEVSAWDDNVGALRSATATPARGTTLGFTLDAKRETNGAFAFALSLFPARTRIPGVGTFRLGWPVALILPAARLDAAGHAGFKLPIPNHPSLSGVRVYTQALVTGKAAFFSNPWTFTIQ